MGVTIKQAIEHLGCTYHRYKNEPYVQKPISFALYQTWKYFDEREKPRKRELNDD